MPGALGARTGGTRYDMRLANALPGANVACRPVALDGAFPGPDARGTAALRAALDAVPPGDRVVIDGLCLATVADLATVPPFVALVHHPADRETGLSPADAARLRDLETRALARAAHVVATSTHTGEMLAAAYGVARPRLGVVPPGVTVSCDRSPGRRRASGPLRLLAVASVTARKGYAVLLDTLIRLRREYPGLPAFRIDCYGSLERDPALVDALRQTIAVHALGDCIWLHGEVDEAGLAQAYAAADLFVHTAHYEGYGMAVADALACGLPVVATAGGAVEDLVPEDAGRLVPPGDANAFAAELASLLRDPALRATLAVGAQRAGG